MHGFTACIRRGLISQCQLGNGKATENQSECNAKQHFFHGGISFSGELRRDNLLNKAVCFESLRKVSSSENVNSYDAAVGLRRSPGNNLEVHLKPLAPLGIRCAPPRSIRGLQSLGIESGLRARGRRQGPHASPSRGGISSPLNTFAQPGWGCGTGRWTCRIGWKRISGETCSRGKGTASEGARGRLGTPPYISASCAFEFVEESYTGRHSPSLMATPTTCPITSAC